MEIFKTVVLSLSGIMLFFVGTIRLFKPIKSYCLETYLKNSRIRLEDDADMLNEMRGVGTVTLFGGIVILLGIVMPQFRITSFVVAIVIFLGFAIGRSLSMGLDGKPNKQLVQGLIYELIFSAVNIIGLIYTV